MDAYDMWKYRERSQRRKLDTLPTCDRCGEPIQDDYLWRVDGLVLCEDCAANMYRFSVEETR